MDAQAKLEEVALAAVGAAFPWHEMQIIERDGWYQTITPSGSLLGNEVVLSQLDAASADEVIRRTIREYAAHGVPFRWAVSPVSRPDDLGARLERHGFSYSDGRGMAIDPAAWVSGRLAPEVSVELVTAANIDDYVEAFERGWDIQVDRVAYLHGLHRAFELGYHMFIARVGGAIAGSGGYVVKPRSGYLVGGNVLPQFRGRGIYRALLDERLRRLRELGIALATTQAREATSAPILDRLGFESVFRMRMYRLDDPRAVTGTAGPG